LNREFWEKSPGFTIQDLTPWLHFFAGKWSFVKDLFPGYKSHHGGDAMTEEKLTYCRICEVYCGLVATVEDGRVTRLRPDADHVVSKGYSCPKGISFHEVTNDPDRVLHPLKKVNGEWQRISWEQAIDEIGARFRQIRAEHGRDAIAIYTGNPAGFSWSHRLYSASWTDAVGTRQSYGAGSQDNLGLFLASKFLYGAYFLRPIPDLPRIRHWLIVASNPAVSQGTLVHAADVRHTIKDIRARGGKVVVVDPRRTETAEIASEHHFIRPDSDVFLLLAMARTILDEGLENREFLTRHVREVDWLREVLAPITPEVAAERTGIAAGTIRRLAREFAAADGACAYGRVVCGTFGTLAGWSLDVLNVLTGNLDRPGGAIFSDSLVDFSGIVTMMGKNDYGKHRSRVSGRPGVLGELPSGVLAEEITTPGKGQIRALLVTAGNPVLSIANGRKLAAAMKQLEITVALDFYMSETASLADYVLPTTTALEREDFPIFHQQLMTEPYGQWTERVVAPLGEAKEEGEIFTLLSDAMGVPVFNSRVFDWIRKGLAAIGRKPSPRWVLDAMIRLGPHGDRYLPWRDGFNLARLAGHPHGIRLPDPPTGVLAKKLWTKDRRIHLRNPHLETELARLTATLATPAVDPTYPIRLIGRRDHRSHNSWMHNVPHLMRGERDRRLRLHPEDAARLGLADGARAMVRSPQGSLDVEVSVTDEVMPGVACLPHGWGHDFPTNRRLASRDPGPNYNQLVDEKVIDPLSGMAFLNGIQIRVELLAAEAPIAAA
jgi:formate dehydrogenase